MPGYRRRTVLAAGGTALATALAGCTGGDGAPATEAEPTATEAPATGEGGLPMEAEVVMRSMPRIEFDPRIAHVAVGGTVTWRLESGSHDTTAYHPDTKPPCRMPCDAEPWASPSMSQVGDTFEWTFEEHGVYDYLDTKAVCTEHVLIGAVGRVVVGWPDPDDQPGLAPPQEELPGLVRDNFEDYNERTRELLAAGPDGGD